MHDSNADLHTLRLSDRVLIHPHNEAGWMFLAGVLGWEEMEQYDRQDAQPMICPSHLPEMLEAAERAGLRVEQQVDVSLVLTEHPIEREN